MAARYAYEWNIPFARRALPKFSPGAVRTAKPSHEMQMRLPVRGPASVRALPSDSATLPSPSALPLISPPFYLCWLLRFFRTLRGPGPKIIFGQHEILPRGLSAQPSDHAGRPSVLRSPKPLKWPRKFYY